MTAEVGASDVRVGKKLAGGSDGLEGSPRQRALVEPRQGEQTRCRLAFVRCGQAERSAVAKRARLAIDNQTTVMRTVPGVAGGGGPAREAVGLAPSDPLRGPPPLSVKAWWRSY